MKRLALPLVLLSAGVLARADLYMQNPPGSNHGALIPSLKSESIRQLEVKTGHLAAGHRTWKPVTIVMLGGKYATDDGALKLVEDAYAGHKPVGLDFSNVDISSNGARKVIYRIHFDGVKIDSVKHASTKDGNPKLTVQFTFTKVTWTALDTGAQFVDTWSA